MSTKIEWTDMVWNPVTGCTPVSEGCDNCYAKRMANRLRGRFGYPEDDPFRVTFHPERLEMPFHWQKHRKVFVNSMGDLFHKYVPFELIAAAFGVMAACPQHTFMILAKRPKRMLEWFTWVKKREQQGRELFPYDDEGWRIRQLFNVMAMNHVSMPTHHGSPWPLPNVWLGVTAENRQTADERIPLLLQCPAAVRFVSCEPLIGPIDLTKIKWYKIPVNKTDYEVYGVPAPTSIFSLNNVLVSRVGDELNPPKIGLDWVIVGGETGPRARPMHPDWARSIRDQCQEAGVPFFFKGWGEWLPYTQRDTKSQEVRKAISETTISGNQTYFGRRFYKTENGGLITGTTPGIDPEQINKVGKKLSGRELDGRTWEEFPR